MNTPTDNTEWLDELMEFDIWCMCGADECVLYQNYKQAKQAILTHIDTVCREAIKEAVDYYAWRFECNTAVSEMYGWKGTLETAKEQTLRHFEATQLNPNKDTPQ